MSKHECDMTEQNGDIARALEQIATDGRKLLNGEAEARERLVANARELIFAAEDPVNTLLWHVWAEPTRLAAARIAVDLKLFETLVQNEGQPKTLAELAEPTGASPKLVRRIARVCVSMRMMDQTGPETYVPNKLTRRLVEPGGSDAIIFCFETGHLSFSRMPEYFRNNNFKNPESPKGPFQYGHNTDAVIFDWFGTRPDVFKAFHGYIHTIRAHRPNWTDMYPAKSQLVDGLKLEGDASALVDIGGSTGQILDNFRTTVPEYTGRLVLQELPPVIEAASGLGLDPRIELQAHDFFDPQPVKGARAYLLRMVLHDWSDDQSRKILGHLRDVMEPGYSKILISDCVVSDVDAAWQHVSLDLHMLALASSLERTEQEWHELINSCDLRIEAIYSKGVGNESLIEVVLP